MKKLKPIAIQISGALIALIWIFISVSFIISDKSFSKYQNSDIQIVAEEDLSSANEHSSFIFLEPCFINVLSGHSFFLGQNFISQLRLLVNNNHFDYLFRHCSLSISIRSILI